MKNTNIQKAKHLLEAGEVVAIPTETVYGLAANAFSDKAIQKIYNLKSRPISNPLIVHLSSLKQLPSVARTIPDLAYKLANEFWPGPLTLVLEKQEVISNLITAGRNTVAVRVPNHPVTLELLEHLPFPLVAPSANQSNHISPTKPDHVRISFGSETPFILDGGQSNFGIESTIIGFEFGVPMIYRHGAISKEQIEQFLGHKIEVLSQHGELLAPGMMKKHYSPRTRLIYTDNVLEVLPKFEDLKVGVLLSKSNSSIEKNYPCKVLSKIGNEREAMNNLYDYLYDLEQMNLDLIIAEKFDCLGVGVAIDDKLSRAAASY